VENKDHWYDGWFYDTFVAPNQDRAFRVVKSLIAREASVLDVGTGTGRLLFQLSDVCSRVDGVDPSLRNIEVAKRRLAQSRANNIFLHHSHVQDFLAERNRRYDVAVLSYVLHEIETGKREEVLQRVSHAAENILIVDYLVPRPKHFLSVLTEVVEFAAGSEHYKNFKSYVASNGLTGLANRCGLKISKEIRNSPATAHIVMLAK
jgi:ubiquinone/menaquinone biosynthesis C-methylase UbiE